MPVWFECVDRLRFVSQPVFHDDEISKGADLSALSRSIDPDWIIRALSSTGKASVRRRKLPAEQVVWLVIALALYRNQSIPAPAKLPDHLIRLRNRLGDLILQKNAGANMPPRRQANTSQISNPKNPAA